MKQEAKKRQSERMLGNKFGCGRKGIKLSDETKKKMSISHKGDKQSEETKRKISDKMKLNWKNRKDIKHGQ